MTTRWLPWLTPLIVAATLAAYGVWWAGAGFVRARIDTNFATRLGYNDAALLDRLTSCSGIFGNCQRKIGFTTEISFEKFRDLVARQGFKQFSNGEPAEPMLGQGERLMSSLSRRNERVRFTDSSGRYDGSTPQLWWWMVRDGLGRTVTIYFYETAGKGYRFDGRTIEGNVVVIAVKE